ncbi:lactate dehydrogenase [Parapedobacter sp. 10938]|uniref:lactate dehydrogenase n=1 Tax=Parapedobacter flavus TaxID=3110225 RepID=UPI002DBE55D0|nr:lactate dehydrogenase [Parapedobacter sp. 10938]MEC3881292.1 lactate dehydrogenase [Parapedobacter sp. 10938]
MNDAGNDSPKDAELRMKAIAYSIKPQEKECLALANGKKHDLTLISNELNERTVSYALGKEAVIVSSYDIVDRKMLWELKHAGVTKIITRSKATTHIDLKEATRMDFKVANVPDEDQSVENIARQTIRNLNAWGGGTCVGKACCCQKVCSIDKKKVTPEAEHRADNSYRYGQTGN